MLCPCAVQIRSKAVFDLCWRYVWKKLFNTFWKYLYYLSYWDCCCVHSHVHVVLKNSENNGPKYRQLFRLSSTCCRYFLPPATRGQVHKQPVCGLLLLYLLLVFHPAAEKSKLVLKELKQMLKQWKLSLGATTGFSRPSLSLVLLEISSC